MEKSSAEEIVGIKKYFFPLNKGVTDRSITPKKFVKDINLDEIQNKPDECISDSYKFLGSFCQYCDYRPRDDERRASFLEVHMRTHTGDKPFSCAVCDYSTTTKHNLETHMRKHTGEKPFQCHECPFSASRKDVLKIHLLIHTNEKPFVCTECNFKCARKKGLQQHWTFHCKFQHFKCSVCDYKCRKSKDLRNHVLTHPANIPCPNCDYMGRCKEDMEKHKVTHMKRVRDGATCPSCGITVADKRYLKKHMLRKKCK